MTMNRLRRWGLPQLTVIHHDELLKEEGGDKEPRPLGTGL
jgi:hypothetical protein